VLLCAALLLWWRDRGAAGLSTRTRAGRPARPAARRSTP
jgi:hypothetical protein